MCLPIDVPKAGFTSREKGVLRKAMSDYAERGGFPDVQDVSPGMRAAMIQEYVDAVLYRDIIERHEVASVQALKYTLEYLFHNYARKTPTRSISGVLKNLSVPANRESGEEGESGQILPDRSRSYPGDVREKRC